jgi:hypothetical protein
MSDRALLELAARAVGYDTSHPMNRERLALEPPVDSLWVRLNGELVHTGWNPITDDGCALRLAVKLQMTVATSECECCVRVYHSEFEDDCIFERHSPDFPDATSPDAATATRRAIVRAAAALATTPKEPTP